MASHTVYAVASGKGGVGKTATTVNLGASLAAAGYDVAVVDTDLGMANLGGFIGVDPDQTLHEVLAGEASLEEATYRTLDGLAVVPSSISLNGFANVDTSTLSDVVGKLREAFDYVLLDLGAGLSHDTVLPLALADVVILVSTPQPVSVRDTAKTREITDRLGSSVAGVVLTRADDPADLSLDDISDTLGLPVLAVIPEQEAVPASAREGKTIRQYDEDSPAVEGYRGLARIVESESLDVAPVVPDVPATEPGSETASEPTTAADAADPEPSAAPDTNTPTDEAPDIDSGATPAPTEGASAGTAEGATPAADSGAGADDPSGGEAQKDDVETTAAEIAAAIEDAANDADGASGEGASASASTAEPAAGSEQPFDSDTEAESAPASDADSGVASDAESSTDEESKGSESASGAESASEDDSAVPGDADATGDADDRADTESVEAFKVESNDEGESDEAEAVDQLFSVEGADPEDLEEEKGTSSGGLLRRFLG